MTGRLIDLFRGGFDAKQAKRDWRDQLCAAIETYRRQAQNAEASGNRHLAEMLIEAMDAKQSELDALDSEPLGAA